MAELAKGKVGEPEYLKAYLSAARRFGGGFGSLLWASVETQEARFGAFARAVPMKGASLLDVGCGRADLLDYLHRIGQAPAEYLGIEAVPELADAAERGGARVLRKDFVAEPRCLFTGSDIIAISGSLNTAKDVAFYDTIRRAYDAAAKHLVFNFLSSSYLAGADHLYWRDPETVVAFCRKFCPDVTPIGDYLTGDLTLRLSKPHDSPR
jgi:hypothetical protein